VVKKEKKTTQKKEKVDFKDVELKNAEAGLQKAESFVRKRSLKKGGPRNFAWNQVTCAYERRKPQKGQDKYCTVLHSVAGYIEEGQMVAVIGPSGAGKTCFLDILAQRKTEGKISGNCFVNGAQIEPHTLKEFSAYVTQEDIFHPTQTVFEAIMYQAELRLGLDVPYEKKKKLCHKLLAEVGLAGKEKQKVGGPLPGGLSVRGLSGGEKRRLSLCCGTITNPSILFLDEPTSGLDSMAALMVMRCIRQYCNQGMMVICTIHQPRPAIWNLFEKVLVLAQGHELYFGDSEDAQNWFKDILQYPKKDSTSVVDYILDLVNVGFEQKDPEIFGSKTMYTEQDIMAAANIFRKSTTYALNIPIQDEMCISLDASYQLQVDKHLGKQMIYNSRTWWNKFGIVMKRNFRNYIRNPGNVIARTLIMVLVATLQGTVYYKIGTDTSDGIMSAYYRMGSMFYTIFAVSLLPFASLSLFIYDRRFYSAEAASRLYPTSVYYLSNILLETCLHTFNALLYALISYNLIGYDARYSGNTEYNPTLNLIIYCAIVILQTNIGSIVLQTSALIAPNQDIAFALAAGYNAISVLTSGYVVAFPKFGPHAAPLKWISFLRFPFQALIKNEFVNTQFAYLIVHMEFDRPRSITGDITWMIGIYSLFACIGYCGLNYLHKERR